ncbi:uncharacterized protein Bfra_005221 [Botrytis fragariae]|uniref:Uncharacterized protein n=1 Tax=Botrytis fragariae TaxID=1964551 RepID=A0A8H6AU83_9HELO|nr:uncharacterized protein Bfra_005221 [Botrytis fragariae]KAF5873757.1 hypothetical protein Bfra_005221 [Botrytis fragariae]
MTSPNSIPQGLDSQDYVDLPSASMLQPSTSFDVEEQDTVSESAGLASVDATMDRNQLDENSDHESEDEGDDEQRGRTRTPRSVASSSASTITNIPHNRSYTPDSTSAPTQPLEALYLNPNLEPNLTLNHIISLPQATILDYISAYHLARQRSFGEYVHPLLAPSQTVAPGPRNQTLNDADEDSDSSSSSTFTPWSMPALSPGPERRQYQDSAGQSTSPHWRLPLLEPLSPSPTTWRPGSGLPLPSPYGSRVRGDDWQITLTGDQDNMARNRRDRESSPEARRIVPSSVVEPENGGSTGIDSESDLQAQIQIQSDRLRQASPDSRERIRDVLTRLVTQRLTNQAREPASDVDRSDYIEAANPSTSQAAVTELRDPNSGNATSILPVLTFNQDGTISFPQRRISLNPVNNSDSSVQERINAASPARRARSGAPALPSETPTLASRSAPNLESANTYYTADSPVPNRSEINRSLFRMEISVRNVRQRHIFELQERREIASLSPEVTSVLETQNAHPSVQDLLVDLESQIGGMRSRILGTDLTRPETPSNGGVNAEVEDSGVGIDLDIGLTRPISRQSDVENDEDAEPSMAEQLAAYQISRNHRNPESSNTNRNIPRNISPHDNSELPDFSGILAGYQNDLSNITTRIQLARRRAELRLAETRIRAGLPIESRDISPYDLENTNTLTRAPRLRQSTSYEDLRLERQLAALSPVAARNTIPARQRTLLPRAQRELDAANAQRMEMLQKPAITVFDHLGKWQLYLENAATRIDSRVPEEWGSRLGRYTLIPSTSSSHSIEDVSGTTRSDEEILAAYSANTSYGFREMLRLVRGDGLGAREAWHYVLLWKDYLSESPIDEYHEALGLCPMDVLMHVVIQGLNRGVGDWKMSARCKRECIKYLVTRTSYYPFPSAETIDAANAFGDVTPATLREYFASDISFLDEEWDMLAALKNERYSTARILHLAKNIARGIAKLDTIDLKPPYDESNNAQRKDVFHRLKLEEIALAGQCGILSTREHQALLMDESSVERVLVEYMLEWELVLEERDRMFQAFDGGASLESLMSSRQR